MTSAPAAGDWDELDSAYARFLDDNPVPPGGSLLAQTILTGAARRSLLPLLEVAPGASVLDLGTGYAPVLLELARRRAVRGWQNGIPQSAQTSPSDHQEEDTEQHCGPASEIGPGWLGRTLSGLIGPGEDAGPAVRSPLSTHSR